MPKLKGKAPQGPKLHPPAKVHQDSPGLAPELEQQFETELCWCIQQLQIALGSGKMNPKQAQDSTKVLNILMNNSAPIIKKRQAMRTTFGDYRAKMAEEDKKLSKTAPKSIKITPAAPSKESVFVKRAHQDQNQDETANGFRFNFPTPEQDVQESSVDVKPTAALSTTFVRSDNSFRFNFGGSTEDTPAVEAL